MCLEQHQGALRRCPGGRPAQGFLSMLFQRWDRAFPKASQDLFFVFLGIAYRGGAVPLPGSYIVLAWCAEASHPPRGPFHGLSWKIQQVSEAGTCIGPPWVLGPAHRSSRILALRREREGDFGDVLTSVLARDGFFSLVSILLSLPFLHPSAHCRCSLTMVMCPR